MNSRTAKVDSHSGETSSAWRDTSSACLWVPGIIDSYLAALRQKASRATYCSHEQKIGEFTSWIEPESPRAQDIERLVVEFIEYLLEQTGYTGETVSGYVYALSNLIAYLYGDDPEIVSVRVLGELQWKPGAEISELAKRMFGLLTEAESSSGTSRDQIEHVITALRQRQFGSRTHAYVETILETKARPDQVRRLDLSAVDLENNLIEVGLSGRFLVGKLDLVSSREVRISESCAQTLREYLEHERASLSQDGTDPVFTTPRGRPSPSTLRRSLRQTSERLTSMTRIPEEHCLHGEENQEGQSFAVVPSDIWWYALSSTIE